MNLLLSNFNFYQNNYSITKDSKNYRIFSKILNDLQITKDLIKANPSKAYNLRTDTTKIARSHYLIKKKDTIKFLNLNLSNILTEFADFNKSKKSSKKFSQDHLFLIFPQLISQFATKQLSEPIKYKNYFFNKSLQLGLLKFVTVLFSHYAGYDKKNKRPFPRVPIKNIIGLKIECSGR